MVKTNGATLSTVPTSAGATSDGAAYTPGVITTDGFGLNLGFRATSPTGTLTVTLYNNTTTTAIATCTVNISDLPAITTPTVTGNTWIFFNFGSQLLVGATGYKVRLVTSSATQVKFYGGASNDWNVLTRIPGTTAAPGAGDVTYILGEYTGAGTSSAWTITQDVNGTTSYGACYVCGKGKLNWDTSGARQLRLNGSLFVNAGGIYNQGTVATPFPVGTASILEFDCASAVQWGAQFDAGAVVTIKGGSKTYAWTKLNADASAAATSLTVLDSVDTNWKNGDLILLTSTTRTKADAETKSLTADGSTTSLTIAAITNAHGGSSASGVVAEIGNLTRNVKIRTVTAANPTYIMIASTATFDMTWVECINMGSGTSNKRGIDVQTQTTGTCNIAYCAIYNTTVPASGLGIFLSLGGSSGITIDNNVVYNHGSGGNFQNTQGTVGSITNNIFALSTGVNVQTNNNGNTFTGNYISSGTSGMNFGSDAIGTMTSNFIHSTSTNGAFCNGSVPLSGTMGISAWRTSGYGVGFADNGSTDFKITITGSFFGNATAGIGATSNPVQDTGTIILDTCTFNAGTTLTQPTGFEHRLGWQIGEIRMFSTTFGSTTTHATGDIDISNSKPLIYLYNCTLSSGTPVVGQTTSNRGSFVRSSRDGTVAGAYRMWTKFGTVQNDTTNFGFTSTVSEKCTPNSSTQKLVTATKYVALNSGQTATVTVVVRKGTGYNGNQLRLMVNRNDSGQSTNAVLASGSSAVGTKDTLTAAASAATENCVFEFYCDGDGTAGFFSVSDWSVSIA